VSSGPQREIEGWTIRKRPGTAMAAAAEQAASHPDPCGLAPDGPAEGHSD